MYIFLQKFKIGVATRRSESSNVSRVGLMLGFSMSIKYHTAEFTNSDGYSIEYVTFKASCNI